MQATDGYAPPESHPPLRTYSALMVIFNGLFAAGLLLARREGRELPVRPALGDIALFGAASHKLSRLITKDKVSSPLRAPFTELEGAGGPGVASVFATLTVSDFLQVAYKAAEEKGLG